MPVGVDECAADVEINQKKKPSGRYCSSINLSVEFGEGKKSLNDEVRRGLVLDDGQLEAL